MWPLMYLGDWITVQLKSATKILTAALQDVGYDHCVLSLRV